MNPNYNISNQYIPAIVREYAQRTQNNNVVTGQSCINQRPQVPCQSNGDCTTWVIQNCAEDDERNISGVCGEGGYCVFLGNP